MKNLKIFLVILTIVSSISCKKFLNEKPDATLATPTSLKDIQALLDNYEAMNCQFPAGSEIYCDNYYLTDDDWQSVYMEYQRHYYLWQPDANNNSDWQAPYSSVYKCNLALESLPGINYSPAETEMAASIKGSALFFRASYFYSLVQLFAKNYDSVTSGSNPGIPIRTTTDFKVPVTRSSVKESYMKIIADLKESVPLLPISVLIKTRPSRAAAYGTLARIYLSMGQYNTAARYADSCLQLTHALMDFNSLDPDADYPIERFNNEVVFQALTLSVDPLNPDICKIDSMLYNSYDEHDLRKSIFFRSNGDGTYGFKGDYDGGNENFGHSFTGIVTDEQYLILAECYARTGKIHQSLFYLNSLLEKRFDKTDFRPLNITDPLELLETILTERRKELLFRGIRTSDLKRLNKETAFQKTLTRIMQGIVYHLPPNDNRYVALLPSIVVEISHVPQNP